MGFRISSGYIGSPSKGTSTANQEVLPPKPSNWTTGYNCYKFSFSNDQACTVIINNGNSIYLRAGQGFDMNEVDAPIYSFKIVEAGITFNYLGAY